MHRRATMSLPCLLVLLAVAPVAAATFKGVSFPDTASIGGKECRLNGVGVRTKFFVEVYLGALYLATPTRDAAAAITADEPKRVVMHFVLSNVGAGKIRDALAEGFRNNAGAALPQLKERIERFVSSVDEDFHEGETVVFTYVPGQGTEIVAKGKPRGVIEGADFMQALWSIWLGPKSGNSGLKRGMLGEQ